MVLESNGYGVGESIVLPCVCCINQHSCWSMLSQVLLECCHSAVTVLLQCSYKVVPVSFVLPSFLCAAPTTITPQHRDCYSLTPWPLLSNTTPSFLLCAASTIMPAFMFDFVSLPCESRLWCQRVTVRVLQSHGHGVT
jgi:hypothetical protein